MSNIETIILSEKVLDTIQRTIAAALEYEQQTDGARKMGITAEVGEVLVCHQLGLRLVKESRSKGYDAIDSECKRVEVKTRRSESVGMPGNAGTTSRFSKHPFDYALLALLDHNYKLCEIWRAEYDALQPILTKRPNPSLSAFKRAAGECPIWTAPSQESP